jgi:hypothetical protein
LNGHAKPNSSLSFAEDKQKAAKKPRGKPLTNVWESMGLDDELNERAIKLRKATGEMMDSVYKDLIPYVESTEFPDFIIPKIQALGINGMNIKDFGGPGLT